MNTLQRVVFEVVDDCLRFSERLINCLSNYDNPQRQRMNCFSIVRCWCGKYEQIPACTPKTLKPLPPLWFLMFFVSFQFTMNQGMRVWICLLQSSHTHTHIHMQLDTLNHYLLSHNFGHHSEQIHIFIFTNMRLSLKIFDSFDTIWFAYFGSEQKYETKYQNRVPLDQHQIKSSVRAAKIHFKFILQQAYLEEQHLKFAKIATAKQKRLI